LTHIPLTIFQHIKSNIEINKLSRETRKIAIFKARKYEIYYDLFCSILEIVEYIEDLNRSNFHEANVLKM
jgi:hypothetical protein